MSQVFHEDYILTSAFLVSENKIFNNSFALHTVSSPRIYKEII